MCACATTPHLIFLQLDLVSHIGVLITVQGSFSLSSVPYLHLFSFRVSTLIANLICLLICSISKKQFWSFHINTITNKKPIQSSFRLIAIEVPPHYFEVRIDFQVYFCAFVDNQGWLSLLVTSVQRQKFRIPLSLPLSPPPLLGVGKANFFNAGTRAEEVIGTSSVLCTVNQ